MKLRGFELNILFRFFKLMKNSTFPPVYSFFKKNPGISFTWIAEDSCKTSVLLVPTFSTKLNVWDGSTADKLNEEDTTACPWDS